jgi:hypothetical protein
VELEGVVQDGVIVPVGECPLANGTKVTVRIAPRTADLPADPAGGGEGYARVKALVDAAKRATPDSSLPTLAERYEGIIGCVPDLPADLAERHDDYIRGTP